MNSSRFDTNLLDPKASPTPLNQTTRKKDLFKAPISKTSIVKSNSEKHKSSVDKFLEIELRENFDDLIDANPRFISNL